MQCHQEMAKLDFIEDENRNMTNIIWKIYFPIIFHDFN